MQSTLAGKESPKVSSRRPRVARQRRQIEIKIRYGFIPIACHREGKDDRRVLDWSPSLSFPQNGDARQPSTNRLVDDPDPTPLSLLSLHSSGSRALITCSCASPKEITGEAIELYTGPERSPTQRTSARVRLSEPIHDRCRGGAKEYSRLSCFSTVAFITAFIHSYALARPPSSSETRNEYVRFGLRASG